MSTLICSSKTSLRSCSPDTSSVKTLISHLNKSYTNPNTYKNLGSLFNPRLQFFETPFLPYVYISGFGSPTLGLSGRFGPLTSRMAAGKGHSLVLAFGAQPITLKMIVRQLCSPDSWNSVQRDFHVLLIPQYIGMLYCSSWSRQATFCKARHSFKRLGFMFS